jgi:hypothetical protein
MSFAHLIYQHWFITCLLLWALTATVTSIVRAFSEAELRRLRVVLSDVEPASNIAAMESRE